MARLPRGLNAAESRRLREYTGSPPGHRIEGAAATGWGWSEVALMFDRWLLTEKKEKKKRDDERRSNRIGEGRKLPFFNLPISTSRIGFQDFNGRVELIQLLCTKVIKLSTCARFFSFLGNLVKSRVVFQLFDDFFYGLFSLPSQSFILYFFSL